MNNTKKMYLVPYQDGGATEADVFEQAAPTAEPELPVKKVNSIRKYAAERQQKLLQIVLKLASYGGYDRDCKIETSNGEKVEIVPLLLHAASPGRNITGISDFVDLLYNAGVQPELIINAGVREELKSRMKNSSRPIFSAKRRRTVATLPERSDDSESVKRIRTEDSGVDVPLPQDKRQWETDSDEEDPLKNGKKFA